jgi:hypothetical protein
LKAVRLANYVQVLRKELLALSHACGVDHPARVTASQIEILDSRFGTKTVGELLGGRGRGLSFDDERPGAVRRFEQEPGIRSA